MIKRPFFCLARPRMEYPVLLSADQDAVQEISLPAKATLLLEEPPAEMGTLLPRAGDRIQTGQRIKLTAQAEEHWISTVTGNIRAVSGHTGYLGKSCHALSVEVEEDQWDEALAKVGDNPVWADLSPLLITLPGCPGFASLIGGDPPLTRLVILGVDRDLLVTTNQLVLLTQVKNLKRGIECLKNAVPFEEVLLVVPPHLSAVAQETGAEVGVINPVYPSAFPRMIMKNVMKTPVPVEGSPAEMGIGFINAEAVAALGEALSSGNLPVHKILTIIHKDGTSKHAKVRIGTPVGDILAALGMETEHGDGLVLGGPMTGEAIFSDDAPVCHDTDAIMVQDRYEVPMVSNSHCVNCGECVRACPADIPVNMLIRVLENGLYDEASGTYDLYSCIECGLCSYVCIVQIPLFHYIMLGKHELARTRRLEESHA